MATYTKSVAEAIGVKEKTLKSSKVYSDGKDIITRNLSNIWETSSSVSTVWDENKTIQKDE